MNIILASKIARKKVFLKRNVNLTKIILVESTFKTYFMLVRLGLSTLP
jgi:hypothetical protein